MEKLRVNWCRSSQPSAVSLGDYWDIIGIFEYYWWAYDGSDRVRRNPYFNEPVHSNSILSVRVPCWACCMLMSLLDWRQGYEVRIDVGWSLAPLEYFPKEKWMTNTLCQWLIWNTSSKFPLWGNFGVNARNLDKCEGKAWSNYSWDGGYVHHGFDQPLRSNIFVSFMCAMCAGILYYYILLYITTYYYILLHITTDYYILLHITRYYYILLHIVGILLV